MILVHSEILSPSPFQAGPFTLLTWILFLLLGFIYWALCLISSVAHQISFPLILFYLLHYQQRNFAFLSKLNIVCDITVIYMRITAPS